MEGAGRSEATEVPQDACYPMRQDKKVSVFRKFCIFASE
jgi:hypothetical protein